MRPQVSTFYRELPLSFALFHMTGSECEHRAKGQLRLNDYHAASDGSCLLNSRQSLHGKRCCAGAETASLRNTLAAARALPRAHAKGDILRCTKQAPFLFYA
jgi:hypothetical protein